MEHSQLTEKGIVAIIKACHKCNVSKISLPGGVNLEFHAQEKTAEPKTVTDEQQGQDLAENPELVDQDSKLKEALNEERERDDLILIENPLEFEQRLLEGDFVDESEEVHDRRAE